MLIGVIAEELLLAEAARQTELFLDVDLFPSASLSVPGFLLLEGQFDEGDVFYQTVVSDGSKIILPQLVIDGDTFRNFTSSIVRALAPSLVLDADAFFSPTVLSNVLGPSLFVDNDLYGGVRTLTQGTANINQQFPIDSVFDSDIFRSPIVELANRAIIRRHMAVSASTVFAGGALTSILPGRIGQAVIITETTSLGASPLSQISPNLFNIDDIIFAPMPFSGLVPGLFIDGDAVFAPTLGNYISPSLWTEIDIFLTPSAAKQLRPSAVSDADVFIGPTLGTPGRLGLVVDNDVVFGPAIRIAPLAPALLVDSDTFSVSVIGAPAIVPNDVIVDFSDTFFTPVIQATQALLPVIWIDVDDYRSPDTIEAQPPLRPILLVDSDIIYGPTEVTGPTALLPGVFSDTDTFFAPSIGFGVVIRTRGLSTSRAGVGSVIVTNNDLSTKTQIIAGIGAVK